MQVVAKQNFELKGRRVKVGDELDVHPDLARAWARMQRADIIAETVRDGILSPNEARSVLGLPEIRQKRRYRRRDMRVED